jgi:hypothetical protein
MSDRPEITRSLSFAELAFDYIRQFIFTILLHRRAYQFIRQHRPWEGLERYGWMWKVLIAIGILLGWQIFQRFFQFFSQAVSSPKVFGADLSSALANFSLDKFTWMLHGGQKYLVLIALEIVTFHFIQRTLQILIRRTPDFSLKAFIGAQKRMIGVSILSWVSENIVRVVVNIPISILGLSFLEKPAGWVIQFFFLGYALIDTYHECHHLTIQESRERTLRVTGVAIAAGLVAYVLMFVPLAGVVAASMLGGVTATLAMEHFAPVREAEVLAYETRRKSKKK